MINLLLPTVHVSAMLKALRSSPVGCFAIDEDTDAGTVKVTAAKTQGVVLRAIQKDASNWIVSHHPELFV